MSAAATAAAAMSYDHAAFTARLRGHAHALWYRAAMRAALAWFEWPCRGEVHGWQHLAPLEDEPLILAINHQSYLDWALLHAYFARLDMRLVFLAKARLFEGPLTGPLMRHSSAIRVADDSNAILDRAGYAALRATRLIGIFPEGTRSADGRLGPAHHGAVKLAARLGRRIVPVTLRGFYESWPKRRALPWPAKCSVHFGAPLSIPRACARDAHLAAATTAQLMARIGEGLE